MLKEKSLKEIVYRYYPQDVISGSEGYRNSKEFLNFKRTIDELRSNRDMIPEQLKSFLHSFKSKAIGQVLVEDYTNLFTGDRCYNIQLIFLFSEEFKSHSICINLSVLAPVFTIHVLEMKRDSNLRAVSNPIRNKELENRVYRDIIEELRFFLMEQIQLLEFPEELLTKVIPNISYQNSNFGYFTYYNAFFLNEPYTR